jgi:hypothetical protein
VDEKKILKEGSQFWGWTKSFLRIPILGMKKSSEGFQFWGWTKFLQNSNSGDERGLFRIIILGKDKSS